MQGLLDAPRQGLARADVINAMAWDTSVTYDAGYELLDANDNVVGDLSAFLTKQGSKVDRDCNATVQGTITLTTEYPHNWGVDRVRPYYLISAPSVPLSPVRFDLGIYVVTTPGQPLGDSAPQYSVTGYDKNYLLQFPIGDAYNIAPGVGYLTAVRQLIAAAGGGSKIILDGTKSSTVLPAARSWSVADAENTTWIDAINALLDEINYRPLWVDVLGFYRSEPYVDPVTLPVEFVMGGGNSSVARYLDPAWKYHTVVTPTGRSINRDSWNHPNFWRFIQAGLTFTPTEGNGQYSVKNQSGGPTSVNGAGRQINAPVQALNASGQADLQAQGDRIVAASIATAEAVTFSSAPIPIAGHFDILTYADPTLPGQDSRKVVVQTWSLPLDGTDMSWNTNVAQAIDSGGWVSVGNVPNPDLAPTHPPFYGS